MFNDMKRLFQSALLFLSITHSIDALSQSPITYQLSLDNITHHELKISVSFKNLYQDTLEIRMPDASPGRYAPHQFAKNVYEEEAIDGSGKPLRIIRKSPNSWLIPIEQSELTFTYTLFANHGDGTYSGVDSRKLHLNMPATFVYGVNLEDRPIHLSIDLTDNPSWSVATQLKNESNSLFTAPNYYYFYDSPVFVGEIDLRSWEVDGQTIEIAMMHEGTDASLDEYTEWVKKVVNTEKKVFGELPVFDFGKYTFLTAYNPYVYGDGMEHRNSTVCSSKGNLENHANGLIGTIAHEFFHTWNVERIRPKSLEPFDFDHANMSEALWFAEGFTSYYDDLTLCRAGIISPEQYIEGLTGTINYVMNSPGRSIRNPIQMSQNAPFVDAGTANDEANYPNNYISYYSYGAALGLILDLSIRKEFKALTLDDFMKNVWIKYGKTEIPYTLQDLQKVLIETTRDEAFARRFFDENIYDSHLPDIPALFDEVGVSMESARPEEAYFGYTKFNEKSVLQSNVLRTTAWYEAGVEKGDRIISINEQPISGQDDFDGHIATLTIGEDYAIVFEQLGRIKKGMFTAIQDPTVTIELNTEAKKKAIKKRASWLWQDQ
jgi:predicted metalloprotease with PDZ domain